MQLKGSKLSVAPQKKSVKLLWNRVATAIRHNRDILFNGFIAAFIFGTIEEIVQELIYTGIQIVLAKALALCLSVTTSTLLSSAIKIIFKKITKRSIIMEKLKTFLKSLWANKMSLVSTITILALAVTSIVIVWLQYTPKAKPTNTADIVVFADEVEEAEEPETEEPEAEEGEHAHSYTKTSETAPTCTANGVQVYVCECGDSYSVVIQKLGHDIITHEAVEPTCETEGNNEYHTCTRCDLNTMETIAKTGHTIVVDEQVDAICGRAGLTEGSHCDVCGKIVVAQEVIPATGTHVAVIDKAVAPTCEADGKTIGSHCFVCGDTIVAQEVVPALDHTYDDGKVIKDATTEEEGEVEFVCLNCGEKKVVKTDKLEVVEEEPVEYLMNQFLPVIFDNLPLSGAMWTVIIVVLAVLMELGVTGKGFETLVAYATRKKAEADEKTAKSIEKEAQAELKAQERAEAQIEAEAQAELNAVAREVEADNRKKLVEQAKAKLLAEQQKKAELKAQIQNKNNL